MANYSTDEDLIKIRPNILSYGETDWEDQHNEATSIVNRDIEARWYRAQVYEQTGYYSEDIPFDPDLVEATQVRRAACYKALELIYRSLMLDTPESDGFQKLCETFAALYEEELTALLGVGIDYDWDSSGTVDDDEARKPSIRTLKRC